MLKGKVKKPVIRKSGKKGVLLINDKEFVVARQAVILAMHLIGIAGFTFGLMLLAKSDLGNSGPGSVVFGWMKLLGWEKANASHITSAILVGIAMVFAKNYKARILYVGAFVMSVFYGEVMQRVASPFWDWFFELDMFNWMLTNIVARYAMVLVSVNLMWFSTTLYYKTFWPKLFGTSFVHSMSTRFAKISRKMWVVILDIFLVVMAVAVYAIAAPGDLIDTTKSIGEMFTGFFTGDFMLGMAANGPKINIGIGTVIVTALGGPVFAFWMRKNEKWLNKLYGIK